MSYGFSAMQGWRVSMEDSHNCIPEFDEDTAMFSVYDGHGGEEVALYCSKYLPEIIKEQKTYKDGKLQKDVIKELVQIAGRPTEEPPVVKVSPEDDLETEEAALLHEEATMTIEELLVRYGQNLNAVKHAAAISAAAKKAAGSNPEASESKGEAGKGKEEVVNGEMEEESNGKGKKGEGAASGSKLRASRRSGGEASGAAADCGGSGSANGAGKAGKAEGDAGPSCSSSKAVGDSKSRMVAKKTMVTAVRWKKRRIQMMERKTLKMKRRRRRKCAFLEWTGKRRSGSDSGTTAVVALIRGKQLIVANAGDSRCVVSERGKAVEMSYDHKPEDELELTRIKNAGGKVTMDGRVNGGLNLSRAIGDHFYKRNKALPPDEQMISSMPDVKVLTLNGDHDFMVIACDGIWNVLSSQEVVDFISERIKPDQSGKVKSLSSIVGELLDHCLAPDTSGDGTGCDNMTCIIITLRPHPATAQPDDKKKRKLEDEKNGNDSKKAKNLRAAQRDVKPFLCVHPETGGDGSPSPPPSLSPSVHYVF
ncbi:hypothetical protein F7725_026174 [Dissostichus mawsoni]|uniref:protein-serine/threonine phosphatase n=1 Tax=Dissostichus mawsoni TaxID=36200 RepID=A0A7J5X795_DISMA|nr:hypothetical protein F7725_026174 [Dissostichus mawsoni]